MKSSLFMKLISCFLSFIFITSFAVVGVNATDETEDYMIYLDISNTDWSAEEGIFCHIRNIKTGKIYNQWGSKSELMSVSKYGEKVLEYNLSTAISDFDASQGKIYGLTFGSANGSLSYEIVMSGYCYNECVYLTQDTNYAGNKLYYGEFCGFSYDYGTHLAIDASNRVYGHSLFENETSAMILADHIVDKALYGTGLLDIDTVNQLLDDVQVSISDVTKEVEVIVNDMITRSSVTQEQGKQLKSKINSVLKSCRNPKLQKNIYFDVFYSGWNPTDTFYCHIWDAEDKGDWNEWRSDAEICDYNEAAGVAIYDLNKTGNNISGDAIEYFIMFGSSSGDVSPYATMSGNCVGDSAYAATYWVEGADIEYTHLFWEKSEDCGPLKEISDDGEIIGFSLPSGTTDEMLLSEYLIKNSSKLTIETVQSLIDNLEVSVDSVKAQVSTDIEEADEEKLTQIMNVLEQCKDSGNNHLYGDVNNDGIINVMDATAIAKYLAEISDIESDMLKYADVNRDGIISIMDVTQIQKIVAGLV